MDWFERLTGFKEDSYEVTQRRLEIVGDHLRSTMNGCSYAIGTLATPSLKELRDAAAQVIGDLGGKLAVSNVSGDVREIHRGRAAANALFQVASQFNLLEMTGPSVSPEDGVTRYAQDHTQGPACAIAAGAATIYRNYFAPVDGEMGQTRDRQIDCLRDVGNSLGNGSESLWRMRNGYALCTASGLAHIDEALQTLGSNGVNELRDRLRIGLHWDVQVTDMQSPGHLVSQAFCSALPVSYTDVPRGRWRLFASLVLEGAYEATIWSAILNAHRRSSRIVYLTRLGGGAFGNDRSWIDNAMRRALRLVEGVGLDARIVSHGSVDADHLQLAREFR